MTLTCVPIIVIIIIDDTYLTPAHMVPYNGADPGPIGPCAGAELGRASPYPGEERYSAEGNHESDDSCGLDKIPEEDIM